MKAFSDRTRRRLHNRSNRNAGRFGNKLLSKDTRRFCFEKTAPLNHRQDATESSGHLYGYEDESGDLGRFRGSDYFGSTIVVISDPELYRTLVETFPKNSRGLPDAPDDELKFRSSTESVRVAFLRAAMKGDLRVYSVITSKYCSNDDTYRSGVPMYVQTLEEVASLVSRYERGEIRITFDQFTSLDRTLADEICKTATERGNSRMVCEDHEGRSNHVPGLQVVDMVMGAIAHRYKHRIPKDERERYWNVIRRRTELIKR